MPVGNKLKQAVGRLRNPPKQILHVTNTHNLYGQTKSLESFREHYWRDAERLFALYNQYHAECKVDGLKPEEDPRLEKYADYAYKSKTASINPTKIDQQINHAYGCEMYNNIDLIENEWRNAYYESWWKIQNS